jgi:DNA-binding NarL/FixJ family response regulator
MKVLLSTDLESTWNVHYQLLESQGVECITDAGNLEEVVASLEADAFDFALCAMGHSDASLKVVRAIRESDPEIPIILIVDRNDRSAIVDAIQSGCSDYLVLPVSKSVLAEKLEKWAGPRSSRTTTRSNKLAETVGSAC